MYVIMLCLPSAVFCQSTVCNKEDCNDKKQDVDKYDSMMTEIHMLYDQIVAYKEETNARLERIILGSYVNIAQGKPAFQSSLHDNDTADKAVDGNEDPDYHSGSCSHTKHWDANPWWAVDLQQQYSVYRVDITNRNDSDEYSQRLHDVVVSVSDVSPPDFTKVQQCTKYPGIVPRGQTVSLLCDGGPKQGRFVIIQLDYDYDHDRVITLCEVKVHGFAP